MAIKRVHQGVGRTAADSPRMRSWILNALRSAIGPIPFVGPTAGTVCENCVSPREEPPGFGN